MFEVRERHLCKIETAVSFVNIVFDFRVFKIKHRCDYKVYKKKAEILIVDYIKKAGKMYEIN